MGAAWWAGAGIALAPWALLPTAIFPATSIDPPSAIATVPDAEAPDDDGASDLGSTASTRQGASTLVEPARSWRRRLAALAAPVRLATALSSPSPLRFLWEAPLWQTYLRSRFDDLPSAPLPRAATAPAAGGNEVSEADYRRAWLAAMASPLPASRQAFLDGIWATHIAPRLVHEEEALQAVAHHLAYMHWRPGFRLSLGIASTLAHGGPPTFADGSPVAYATRYVVEEVVGDPTDGAGEARPARLTAFWLLPEGDAPGPAMVLFRGTRASSLDVLAAGDVSGVDSDIDPRGVGHAAFAAHAERLRGWVNRSREAGRGVVIVGHSLGGALGARLLASFDAADQLRLRLVALAPAGVEAEVADAIVARPGQVLIVLDADDVVSACGARLPPGHVIETFMWQRARLMNASRMTAAHLYPSLAAARLGWAAAVPARLISAARIEAPPAMLPEVLRRTVLFASVNAVLALSRWWPQRGIEVTLPDPA